jgi:hypothetical protein
MAKIIETEQKKWSDDMLRQFYAELLNRFGPHKKWQAHSFPSKGRKQEFDNFIDNFTDTFHVAPRAQLAWATTHQSEIGLCSKGKPQDYNQRNYMRNRLAAYDQKFIDKEYFADILRFENHYPVRCIGLAGINAKMEEGSKPVEKDFSI